jgi:F-type H+-transporting ATPase subunit a
VTSSASALLDVLAAEGGGEDTGFHAPTVEEFYPEPLVSFGLLGVDFEITRITLIMWVATALIIGLMAAAVRKPSIVPLAQISPMSKFAFPLVLAVITWIIYNWVGIREQGAGRYFKDAAVPPGVPIGALILVTPIELLQVFVIRPFTLAVRLFANMFAGHMLLAVFALGTVYLLQVGNFSVIFSPFAFLMALIMTFFELLVIVLQAYVFTVLTATYLNGAVEPAH